MDQEVGGEVAVLRVAAVAEEPHPVGDAEPLAPAAGSAPNFGCPTTTSRNGLSRGTSATASSSGASPFSR